MFRHKLSLIFTFLLVFAAFSSIHTGAFQGHPADAQEVEIINLTSSWLWDPYAEELEDWQYFKRPGCIETGPDGDLFIADTGNARVVRFREDGQHEIVGRSGAGPGEFDSPVDLYVDHGERLLWVADAMLQRISLFQIQGEGSTFVTSFRIQNLRYQHSPNLVPSRQDTSFYFLAGLPGQRIVHVTNKDETIREFGDDLPPPEPGWRVHNDGYFSHTASRHLIFVSKFTPIIEKYSLEGELVESVSFFESEFRELVADTKRERRRMNSDNIIISMFNTAYIPHDSNNVYVMRGGDLICRIDSSDMRLTANIQIGGTPEGTVVEQFCVVESGADDAGLTMYGIEWTTKGIMKLSPKVEGLP